MSGNMAINPYGAHKDPYFLAAHQFPNANAMTQYQYSPYLQIPGATQGAQQSPQVVQQYPQAAATNQTAQPKKKGGTAALIIGGIALTGAAILCHHKGNPDLKFFQRLWDGAKVYKDIVVNWCKGLFNKTKKLTAGEQHPLLDIPTLKGFRECGGVISGEEAITATGERFTGALRTSSGRVLNFANGALVNT